MTSAPGPEQLVDDPKDRRFVAGNRRRRNDDSVASADRDLAVVAVGDPAQDRHRFALAAGDDVDDLIVGQHSPLPSSRSGPGRDRRDSRAPSRRGHCSRDCGRASRPCGRCGRGVDDLLDACDQRGEGGDDDAAFGLQQRSGHRFRRRLAPTVSCPSTSTWTQSEISRRTPRCRNRSSLRSRSCGHRSASRRT